MYYETMKGRKILYQASLLRDSVFGASDGIITTFAVVTGSLGASLSPHIVLVLGFANLFADGFSMAVGNYMGMKSQIDFENANGKKDYEGSPLSHGFVTFLSFNIAGTVPLLPYLLGLRTPFTFSLLGVFIAMFFVGAMKSRFTKKNIVQGGIEMVVIGGVAALISYFVGDLIDTLLVK